MNGNMKGVEPSTDREDRIAQPLTQQGWAYRAEEHLGSPAYSLFDPAGERSAVGLVRHDAAAICDALNLHADLLEALERIAAATPESANTDSIASFQSWVRAVANTAIAKAGADQ